MDSWRLVVRIAQGVVRRRKRLVVAVFLVALGIFVPAAYYLSKEPARFRTSAVVLLEARADRVPLFTEFVPTRPVPVQMAILQSRSLAEAVMQGLPQSSLRDLVDQPYYVDYELELKNTYRRFIGAEPEVESPQRRALKELQRGRIRFVDRGAGIVEIAAEASKPSAAVDIANGYVEALLARTRSFNLDDARTTREFLEQQVGEVKEKLKATEDVLQRFTAANGGIRIPERSQATQTQLTQVESDLADLSASRKMMQTRLQALRAKVETDQRQRPAAAPGTAAAPPIASAEVARMRAQLTTLEATLIDLRMKYTDAHPRIALVQNRIAELQRQLGDSIKSSSPVTTSPAIPLTERTSFQEQLVALETSYHTMSAQEDALRQQAASLRQSLSGLSKSEVVYGQLMRDVESNRSLLGVLSDKLTASRIREQGEMKVVKVIDPADAALPVVGGRRLQLIAVAFLAALLTGAGLPAGIEWMRRRIETDADVEEIVALPVLAALPRMRLYPPQFVTGLRDEPRGPSERFIFTEALRGLRVALQLERRASPLRTIMITSAFDGEGKSTLVANLGLALAEAGKRVVLAETDFQRPTLHRVMKVKQSTGLLGTLHATQPLEQALAPVAEGLWLAQRGDGVQPTTRGLLAETRLGELVAEMADRADFVICDSSPVLLVPDGLFLASAVDAVIVVVRAGSTSCQDLLRTKALLEHAGAKILGVVINETPVAALRPHYRRYYYAYAKRETNGARGTTTKR